MTGVVGTLRVNVDRMAEALDDGYTQATDLSEFIVQTCGVDYRSAYDVVGRITGSEWPDQWIVRGNHYDGWVNGASDPISGQSSLIEEAHAFERLMRECGLTQEQVAQKTGKDRTSIANHLRLLRLPAPVQEMLSDGRLSAGHARALAGLDDEKAVIHLAKRIVEKGLSVRQAEELVASPAVQPARQASKPAAKIDPNIRAAVLELERTLGTRVRIAGNPTRGQIEIKYFSAEDLNRLYAWIIRQ